MKKFLCSICVFLSVSLGASANDEVSIVAIFNYVLPAEESAEGFDLYNHHWAVEKFSYSDKSDTSNGLATVRVTLATPEDWMLDILTGKPYEHEPRFFLDDGSHFNIDGLEDFLLKYAPQ